MMRSSSLLVFAVAIQYVVSFASLLVAPSDAEQRPNDPTIDRRSLHDDMAPKWHS